MNKKYGEQNIIVSRSSIGIGSLLGLIFIVLKLCGIINWSWWWVTAPFWIPVGLVTVIVLIACIIVWLVEWYETKH